MKLVIDEQLPEGLQKSLSGLQIEVVSADVAPQGYFLKYTSTGGLELRRSDMPKSQVIVDFAALQRNLKNIGGRSDLLVRALGRDFVQGCEVIDASCGLGTDACHLSLVGCQVRAFERNPVAYLLVKSALLNHSLFRLEFGALSAEEAQGKVIYFDPMYPKTRQKRLSRKEMSWFQDLVGTDEDADFFIAAWIEAGAKKVIVKRPVKYVAGGSKKPRQSLTGKSVRYDIY